MGDHCKQMIFTLKRIVNNFYYQMYCKMTLLQNYIANDFPTKTHCKWILLYINFNLNLNKYNFIIYYFIIYIILLYILYIIYII